MAITVHKDPQQLQPVYNEIVCVLSSDLSSEGNFNFLTEIEVAGQVIASIQSPVNPQGYGVIDLHKHLQSLVTEDFNPNNHNFVEARQSYIDYNLVLKESFRPVWNFQYYLNLPIGNQIEFVGVVGEDPNVYYSVGDTILIAQQPPYTYEYINGVTTISAINYDPANNYWKVVVTKTITHSTPGVSSPGRIVLPNFQNLIIENTTLTGYQAFNGVRSYLEFINWDYTEYDANQITGQGKWLTNVPSPYNIQFNSNIWLNVYSSTINNVNYLKITTDFGNYYMENTLTGGGENLFQVNVSPESLINQTLLLPNGNEATQPIFSGIDECYSVSIVENLGDITGVIEPITFCITSPCTRYEDVQLVFMDKLGSFIPFHFNLVNRHTKSINRTNYQQDYGKYAPVTNNWEYNTWDRGTKTLDTQVTESFTVNSDWVDQETSDFLMTLFESPEVYWFKEDGTVVGINLTVSNVERKQVINDQLINYTVTFELSNKNKQQIG